MNMHIFYEYIWKSVYYKHQTHALAYTSKAGSWQI